MTSHDTIYIFFSLLDLVDMLAMFDVMYFKDGCKKLTNKRV